MSFSDIAGSTELARDQPANVTSLHLADGRNVADDRSGVSDGVRISELGMTASQNKNRTAKERIAVSGQVGLAGQGSIGTRSPER